MFMYYGEILLSVVCWLLVMNNEIVGCFVCLYMNGVVNFGVLDDIGDLVLLEVLCCFVEVYLMVVVDVCIEVSEMLWWQVVEGKLDIVLFNCMVGNFNGEGELFYCEKFVWVGKKCGNVYVCMLLFVLVWEVGCIWCFKVLDVLEKFGQFYCIVYFSVYYMGQWVVICVDIVIVFVVCFLIVDDMMELGEVYGLFDIGYYDVGMVRCVDVLEMVDVLVEYI